MAPKTKKVIAKKPTFVEKQQPAEKKAVVTPKKTTTAPKKAAPTPKEATPTPAKKATPKKTVSPKKTKKASAALEEGVDGVIEYESLGKIDDWDWTETTGVDSFVSDDAGGFLCLEEISDVEVEYEGDDVTGKVAKFKRVKKADRKAGKKAQPTVPLEMEGVFYDVDTFDEDLAAEELAKESAKEADDEIEKNGRVVDANDENKRDSDDPMDIDDAIEEIPEAKVVEKKTKAQKLLEKKKKEIERLMSQVEKMEATEKKAEVKTTTDASAKKPVVADNGEPKPMNKRERLQAKKKAQEEALKLQEKIAEPVPKSKRPTVADVDQSVDVSAWDGLNLCENVVNALKYNKFNAPTPIQKNTLPLALKGRDIIGSAETGSGKTLAFGIPIINYLDSHVKEGLTGLILTPTRELAIQVKEHIEKMAVFSDIRCVAIVGGMSIQKQERLVKNNPDIIVATPGRLWEIFSNNPTYMEMLKHVKFLVLDEADRMLEKGHFEELTSLLNTLSKKRQDTTEWPEELEGTEKKSLPQDLGVHQTFIFTATFNKDLRFNVKAKRRKIAAKPTNSMEDLLSRIEFADSDPALVDMTSDNVVASTLLEARVDCLHTDKDLYVYYFVTRYPGRTIIFVNSIDAIRRLVPVFKLLNLEVLGLHAQMQQKQRLKNLERFKANPKAVLVASDVAARGLDIPLVDHVIHYQLPRSGEIYVHRSGRTARANRDGVSLLLCGPDETRIYHKLCQTLRKGVDYPLFPIDLNILKAMTDRVKLAAEIDSIQHQESKQVHEVNWMRNMAKDMDVDFDEDTMQGKGHQKSSDELERAKVKALNLKNKLAHLIKQPILPAGASMKFLTGGLVTDFVDRLMKKETSELLPGSSSSKAFDDLHSSKKRKIQETK
ncbi:P-loop containing nucleoside triphosphate hydrolase protein [Mucor mucedo]|uniref:P-loop containing nucleoside triphosphate hydrolase protein n=1 Tax=Mucor mucedo TaxID=29922 RepID=UPI00221E5D1B|nr:P-loop containing nucleoside triphosphate hydrolase protein [Mucor mucedo]KAI7890155.1 P-loop containing nucleoside triphosphate hydrolase protein [Mucor mucedo]